MIFFRLKTINTVTNLCLEILLILLEKNFSDMKAGEKMLISSPEVISNYISKIPVGTTITPKEMRHALAKEKGADNTCPVTTGIFLRIAIEEVLDVFKVDDAPIPFWRS